MNTCSRYPCGWVGGYCTAMDCPNKGSIQQPFTIQSPRTMPVNIPFSLFGITIVTLDGHGNLEIKVDQPYPPSPQETTDGH